MSNFRIGNCLKALYSDAEYIVGEDYNSLQWLSNNITKPTEIEIEAKRIELLNALPMKILREKRNIKLNDTDKYAIPDFGHPTDIVKQAWLTYRQALRNLPSNSSPQLDDNGELTNVNWPIPPS
jgi:hypothetical protein